MSNLETEAGGALLLETGKGLLDADKIPNKNQSESCFSCDAVMVGVYCKDCGQKNDDLRRSIWALGGEMLSNLTAYDNRVWRTCLALLFRPGLVAREFADGKRTKWTSPIRVYLAMSLILFGFISVTDTQIFSADFDIHPKDGVEKSADELLPSDIIITGSLNMFEPQKRIDARNANRNFDLIDVVLDRSKDYGIDFSENGISFEKKTPIAADLEGQETAQEILRDLGINIDTGAQIDPQDREVSDVRVNGQKLDRLTGQRALKEFIRNPTRFNAVISTWLPRIMFFMMPFTMFLGVVFIRGRGNALMYDHLVHSAYIHAVTFFLLFGALILSRITWVNGGILTFGIFGYLALYLPISLRKMFKRGVIKTVWTSYMIGATYLFWITILILILIAFGFQNLIQTP